MREIPSLIWRYLREVLTACTQLLNALCGGQAKETASSSLHRLEQAGRPLGNARAWVDGIFRVLVRQEDHCRKAYDRDRIPFK